jgi:predicted ABC-type ATPase
MSIYDYGYQNLKDHAKRNGVDSIPEETGFMENFSPTKEMFQQEMVSTSESNMIGDHVRESAQLYKDMTKSGNIKNGVDIEKSMIGEFETNKQFLEDNHQAILDFQVQNPDSGIKTIDEIMQDAQERARLTREKAAKASANSSASGTLGTLAGGVVGVFSDPVLVGSMLLGTGKITGPSKALNAWKAFKTEAAIGMGAETLITPSVMSWKDKINSPYSLKDATINILTVGAFAGVARAGGSYVVDVFEARKAIKTLRAEGKDGDADIVESYVDLQEKGISNQDAHVQAYAKAQEALDSGKIVEQAELDKITGGKVGLESVDPKGVEVDAATFQFKESSNALGVTDALKGIKEWDPIKAGTSVIWERADGVRFIADGHQRLALAKRLIGDDAQDIGLNAFIMRETDGYSAEAVRDIAAFKNIAEGTGSAIDAAKVIRSGNDLAGGLPPNSALVRDAQGLSKLDDAAFKLIVDEKIDAKYGAIIGDLVSNAEEQSAVIRALSKAKPANSNQARIMVNDMRAAGFEKTQTQDLFGGMEITESLFKERAKVIDSVMHQIKKDKSVFKTLAEQESRIAGAGNKLDRNANLARLSDDERTLATITSLANNRGPVSDAINKAAKQLKSGDSLQVATRDLLSEIKRAGDSELPNGDLGRGGDVQPTLTITEQIDALPKGAVPLKVVPPDMPGYSIGIIKKDGKPITVVNIDRSKIDVTCKDFCYPELKPAAKIPKSLLIDTRQKYTFKNGKYKPKRAKEHEEYINKELAKGSTAADGEKPIVWLMGGGSASGKGTVLEKVQADGLIPEKGSVHADPDNFKITTNEYKDLSRFGDYRAASVVHNESSDVIEELIEKAISAKKNLIIDKTLGNPKKALALINRLKADGYSVRLIGVTVDPSEALVRSLTRYFGSGRLVQSGAALERHKGFNANFDKYAKETEVSILFDNTANSPVKIAQSSQGRIDIVSKEGYNLLQARGKLNEKATTHQELRESQGLEPTLARSDKQGDGRDTGRVAEGDQRTKSQGSAESSQARLNDQLKDSGLDLDDPYLNELNIAEAKQVDDLFAQHGDIQIAVGKTIDGNGDEVIEFKSAREVMQELDDEAKVVDDMFKCMGE